MRELFGHVPEELRLEKVELNRAETRIHNFIEFIEFIEFIASGPRHPNARRRPEPSRGAGEARGVGRPYYMACCEFDALNLLVEDEVRIHCIGGGAGNRTLKTGNESGQVLAKEHEIRGGAEPRDSREFVQVGANYDARHREAAARRYLEAGARGEPCAHLALELAAAVVGDAAVQLAVTVLAGGEFMHSRATQLAALVLKAAVPVAASGALACRGVQ